MSYVSNALLTSRYVDRSSHDALVEHGWACVNRTAGGSKAWEADTFMKAFNHTLLPAIVAEAERCLVFAEGCLLVIHDEADEDDMMHVWFRSTGGGSFVPVASLNEAES